MACHGRHGERGHAEGSESPGNWEDLEVNRLSGLLWGQGERLPVVHACDLLAPAGRGGSFLDKAEGPQRRAGLALSKGPWPLHAGRQVSAMC